MKIIKNHGQPNCHPSERKCTFRRKERMKVKEKSGIESIVYRYFTYNYSLYTYYKIYYKMTA